MDFTTTKLLHGGDYNPEQWLDRPDILEKDVSMLTEAGCNVVSLGIFSWSTLEPEEGVFHFEWLEKIIQNLYEHGISTILATPSGARPKWLADKYPEVLRVDESRHRNLFGGRHNHCYTSPVYREKVALINRKLSERLKFGFRQAIKNGHVLGNDKLYGYDKKDCVLTVNEEEAEIVRIIFDLYGNQRLGTRTISKRLMELGYTSREGNAFNTLTIRHILENPKYKGWYCGNKSQSVDYRTKRNVLLDESEWVTYPDPSIPAIVPEELWNRANALYRRRREEMKSHGSGLSFHNRYPYSTKIYCEEHGTTFHRQVIQTKKGQQEVWQCKVYRSHGRAACSAPQIRSSDLDFILGDIFKELIRDKQKIIDSLVTVLTNIPKEVDYGKLRCQVENEMDDLERKKNRLLDLSIAGALTVEEFKERNDAFNVQILECHGKLTAIRQEENQPSEELDIPAIRQALDEALRFTGEIDTALVATILDKVVVKKESTKDAIHLDIFLKLGSTYEAVYTQLKHTAGITSLKNTTHKPPTRRT